MATKARVEITFTDIKTRKLIGADKQVSVGIDSAESVAGKQALQNATSKLILRLFPKLVKK